MRTVGALLLLVALTGCASGGEAADDPPTAKPFSPAPSSGAPRDVDLSGTEVCRHVRDGVDAFNLGDIEATIDEFEAAVPLAEQLATDQPSHDADVLLRAVRYYALIPADHYVEASQSARDFLLYKEFTLAECGAGGPVGPAEPGGTGVPA